MWLLCCGGGEENSPSLQEHQTLYAWRKAPAEMPALCKESWERNTCRWKEGSKRGFCFRYANVDTTLRLQRGKKDFETNFKVSRKGVFILVRMEAILLSSPEVGDTMMCRTEEDVECKIFYFVGDDV